MTIVHLLGSGNDGGAERYFIDLLTALQAQEGDQAAVIRPHAARLAALEDAGVPTTTAPFSGLADFATAPVVGRVLRAQHAPLAVQWMNRAGRFIPPGPWRRVGRLGGYYNLRYYRGCDHLIANTADIARWIVEQGWPAARVSHIPNFAEPGPQPALDRAALDTPEDAPLLLAMGRLHPVKAHDTALRVLARLPGAVLWIAGAGPLEAELRAEAARLGVAGRVRWLGWREDASALYRAADVCLFPSRFEPLGNVVIQAWAHGLPVVAAAAAGPAALISPGEDGLLAPVDDDAALAAAVRRLLEEPGLRARLAERGRAKAAAEFGREAVLARWRALFGRLAGG
ncbi:MAG: glycosyltransferase [Caulobacteraceae bacterium]|nr:glycosyltransferase [Caulobacter sp.]